MSRLINYLNGTHPDMSPTTTFSLAPPEIAPPNPLNNRALNAPTQRDTPPSNASFGQLFERVSAVNNRQKIAAPTPHAEGEAKDTEPNPDGLLAAETTPAVTAEGGDGEKSGPPEALMALVDPMAMSAHAACVIEPDADAKLLQAHDFQLDESLLTGESVPVPRKTGDAARAGTLVVRGTATAHVFAIGATSEIGKIGHSLKDITSEPPRLQRQTRALVRLFAVLGGGTAVLAVLLYGSLRGEWLDGILVFMPLVRITFGLIPGGAVYVMLAEMMMQGNQEKVVRREVWIVMK